MIIIYEPMQGIYPLRKFKRGICIPKLTFIQSIVILSKGELLLIKSN